MAIDWKLFDQGVNREDSWCVKWDLRQEVFGRADVIALWVADMDFAAPQTVIDALVDRARHGAFGYSKEDPADKRAVVNWMVRRHDVRLAEEDVLFSPGVIDSMRVALGVLAKPGDKIVVQPPVYGPFYSSVEFHDMQIVRCPMLHEGGQWSMDFDALEKAFADGAKATILCNPHNPVGRVWTREELETLAKLARRYGVAILSDEIHADLEMPEYKNTSILNVEPDAIALVSATKTFNLAALRHSSVLIRNPELREAFKKAFERTGVGGGNLFGALAQRVAYETGDEWLDALRCYLAGTRDEVEEFLRRELPEITCARLEGTYLMWLDFRALGMEQEELARFLVHKAGLGLGNGTGFGEEGAGFMRLNIGTPRANVRRALEQLKAAVKERG